MCLPTQANQRARTLFVIGQLCLVLSLLPQVFDITFRLAPSPLHFLRGFLLGVSLVFLLTAVWRIRREHIAS
jgi:hypothetical protein